MKLSRISKTAVLGAALLGFSTFVSAAELTRADLFRGTNIVTAHFKFAAEQWEKMEPKGAPGGFMGMFGGGGGGRGGFGSGNILGPALVKAADQDNDGKVTAQEFAVAGEKWFTTWDKANAGKLNAEQVGAGLGTALSQAGDAGPSMLQGREGQRNGLSAMMGVEFEYVHADLELEGKTFQDVATRYKGNGTFMDARGSLKRSMKVDLNEFKKGQRFAGRTKLNFHNNITDASFMNETLAYRLFRDAGVAAPETVYTRLFVTVPGKHDKKYFGLYSLVENVDEEFAEDRFKVKKGAIFKPTTRAPFTDLGDDWARYKQIYDPKTELTAAQKQRVIALGKLVSKADDKEFAAQIGNFVDLEQFARFLAVTVYLSSGDSILSVGQNYYVYLHPTSQKFSFIPWDHDHSFNDFLSGVSEYGNLSINHPWSGENRFFERIFNVPAFKDTYLARMKEFNQTLFQPARLTKQVDELAVLIRPMLKEESEERLARFEKVVAGMPVTAPGFGFMMPPVKPIKAFVGPRSEAIDKQLAGKSEGIIPSGGFGGGGPPGGGRPPGGGPGGPGRGPGGPGGPGGGPGGGLGRVLMAALDTDKDGSLAHAEFTAGFAKWFKAWDADGKGVLTEDQIRAGLSKDVPIMGGFGGPPPPPSN